MDWQDSFQRKYEMLQCLLVESRRTLAETNPALDAVAPPVEDYLVALDFELSGKNTEERLAFLNEELSKALSSASTQHPMKRELQQNYQSEIPWIVQATARRIQNGETFDQIQGFLAHERARLALEYCQYPIAKFGRARQDATRLYRSSMVEGGWFGAYLDRVLAQIPVGLKDFRIPAAFDSAIGAGWAHALDGLTVWVELGPEKIPLTTILVCRMHYADIMMEWLFGDPSVPYPSATMIHTDVQQLPKLWKHCRDLFSRVVEGGDFVKQAAELQWFMAHAMFFERGSAAMEEWLIEALFQAKGYRLTWKKQPDLEALLRFEPQGFVACYPEIAHF